MVGIKSRKDRLFDILSQRTPTKVNAVLIKKINTIPEEAYDELIKIGSKVGAGDDLLNAIEQMYTAVALASGTQQTQKPKIRKTKTTQRQVPTSKEIGRRDEPIGESPKFISGLAEGEIYPEETYIKEGSTVSDSSEFISDLGKGEIYPEEAYSKKGRDYKTSKISRVTATDTDAPTIVTRKTTEKSKEPMYDIKPSVYKKEPYEDEIKKVKKGISKIKSKVTDVLKPYPEVPTRKDISGYLLGTSEGDKPFQSEKELVEGAITRVIGKESLEKGKTIRSKISEKVASIAAGTASAAKKTGSVIADKATDIETYKTIGTAALITGKAVGSGVKAVSKSLVNTISDQKLYDLERQRYINDRAIKGLQNALIQGVKSDGTPFTIDERNTYGTHIKTLIDENNIIDSNISYIKTHPGRSTIYGASVGVDKYWNKGVKYDSLASGDFSYNKSAAEDLFGGGIRYKSGAAEDMFGVRGRFIPSTFEVQRRPDISQFTLPATSRGPPTLMLSSPSIIPSTSIAASFRSGLSLNDIVNVRGNYTLLKGVSTEVGVLDTYAKAYEYLDRKINELPAEHRREAKRSLESYTPRTEELFQENDGSIHKYVVFDDGSRRKYTQVFSGKFGDKKWSPVQQLKFKKIGVQQPGLKELEAMGLVTPEGVIKREAIALVGTGRQDVTSIPVMSQSTGMMTPSQQFAQQHQMIVSPQQQARVVTSKDVFGIPKSIGSIRDTSGEDIFGVGRFNTKSSTSMFDIAPRIHSNMFDVAPAYGSDFETFNHIVIPKRESTRIVIPKQVEVKVTPKDAERIKRQIKTAVYEDSMFSLNIPKNKSNINIVYNRKNDMFSGINLAMQKKDTKFLKINAKPNDMFKLKAKNNTNMLNIPKQKDIFELNMNKPKDAFTIKQGKQQNRKIKFVPMFPSLF